MTGYVYGAAEQARAEAWWAEQRARNQPAYDERIARWRKEIAEGPSRQSRLRGALTEAKALALSDPAFADIAAEIDKILRALADKVEKGR